MYCLRVIMCENGIMLSPMLLCWWLERTRALCSSTFNWQHTVPLHLRLLAAAVYSITLPTRLLAAAAFLCAFFWHFTSSHLDAFWDVWPALRSNPHAAAWFAVGQL